MGAIKNPKNLALFFILLWCQACAPIFLPISKDNLYVKGRIAVQSPQSDFLGSVEIWSHSEQLLFFARDSFFRPILQFSLTKKKIIIIQNKKTYRLANNSKNRKKILGLDLNNKEFEAILWGKKKFGAGSLKFSGSPQPLFVEKKNTGIKIDYLAWKETQGLLLPAKLEISNTDSDNQVSIKLVITAHKINTSNKKI